MNRYSVKIKKDAGATEQLFPKEVDDGYGKKLIISYIPGK